MIISSNDIDWLNQNYSKLAVESNNNDEITIKGVLEFSATYNEIDKNYIINPNLKEQKLIIINDRYSIEVIAYKNLNKFPIVKEIDSRILNLAKKQNKDSRDLHVYSGNPQVNNILCILGPIDQEIIKGNITLPNFIEKLLIPFFYDNSYYEQYNFRPRADYNHGIWGVLENYFDIYNTSKNAIEEICLKKLMEYKEWLIIKDFIVGNKKIKGHHKCLLCGNIPIRKCHNKIFLSIAMLSNKKLSNLLIQ